MLFGLAHTSFNWSTECEAAFSHLKTLLTQSLILAYLWFGEEFLLETDASGVGLGAVMVSVNWRD